jgi:Icc-related predicted phosphoesterase
LLRFFREVTLTTTSTPRSDVVRVAAVADLHVGRTPIASIAGLFAQVSAAADVVALCGDITDHGQLEEGAAFVREAAQSLRIPAVVVLGNHDYEAGHAAELRGVWRDAGMHVLDGDACEVRGVNFAGTKGFCGGFGPRALGSWGEPLIKQFVKEAVNEALKLEAALARLRSTARIALLHYSPVVSTVEGEPLEIYPFLGSSRLEEPLSRYTVSAAFHGHAHRGQIEGKTTSGVPVFNVSWPLLQKVRPGQPFHVLELRPGQRQDGVGELS